MKEKKKHKIMIGIEVVLLCMLVAILGTNAASSNPPSNGVSYGGNNQTTVEGALNDLYNKANYGNASAGDILSGKTALVGGKKITGTMPTMQGSGHVDVSETVAGNHSQNGTSYLYYKIPPHTYTGDVEWLRSSYADVANRIGLTAGKLVKGQTVLGITGTGTTGIDTSGATAEQGDILSGKTAYVNGSKVTGTMTNKGAVSGTVSPGGTYTIPAGYHNGSGKATCSTCEAEGYYKYYYFNKDATVKESYVTYDGTWRRMAHEQLSGCSGGTCTSSPQNSVFEIDLGFTPSQVKEYHVFLEPKRTGAFRISASTGNWNMYQLMAGVLFENSSSQNVTFTRVSISGSKLQFLVGVSREAMTNGTSDSAISTNASSFILKGYIVYK